MGGDDAVLAGLHSPAPSALSTRLPMASVSLWALASSEPPPSKRPGAWPFRKGIALSVNWSEYIFWVCVFIAKVESLRFVSREPHAWQGGLFCGCFSSNSV